MRISKRTLESWNLRRLKSLGLDRLKLTTNFRSVPSILSFVDAAFENAMKPADDDCRYQPEYLAFRRSRIPEGGIADALGPPSRRCERRRAIRNAESREIRRKGIHTDRQAHPAKFTVQNPGRFRIPTERGGDGWRAPQYGDIAILLPVLTHADVLEDEFRDLGIPYVLEGGKFYYARSEVSSAIMVLRAVANPNDSVALYGSLRSIFFGLSDEDLLRAHIDGLSLDYRERGAAANLLSIILSKFSAICTGIGTNGGPSKPLRSFCRKPARAKCWRCADFSRWRI